MRAAACLLASALLLASCTAGPASSPSGSPSASAVTIPDAGPATIWGNGPYGLVLLAPSAAPATWGGSARAFAADGMTVVALERTDAGALRAAIGWLRTSRQVPRVAVLAVGEAARTVAEVGSSDPSLIDQAIVISPPAGLDWTAQFPKLFATSSGEPAAGAARQAADQAAGTWNALLEVPGSASGLAILSSPSGPQLMDGLLRRLDERR